MFFLRIRDGSSDRDAPLERSARVRAAIAEALGDLAGIKSAKATVTAALRAALKDADPAVRQAAQKALPRVGAH